MPFDVRDFPGLPPDERAASATNRRLVAAWLFLISAMIAVMIGLGGVTRVTGSGLSIMEWAPIRGVLPPLNDADWQRLFALYKEIPQYTLLHEGFGIEGFKQIFWLEWIHRLWGRLIGIAFLGPLIWFWVTGRIERRLFPRLAIVFAVGALQGGVGWFMVASGFFPDSTAVSAYRLVIHLVLALALYGAILWTGLSVLVPERPAHIPPLPHRLIRLAVGLVVLTIIAGGLVAGTHAGLDYNTFPLMAGQLVPDAYDRLSPFWRNLTENIAAVQFDHRLLATLTGLTVLAAAAAGLAARPEPGLRRALIALALAIAAQYALGVASLLAVVPPALAVTHQLTAVLVLTAALLALHRSGARAGRRG
ncbi:MAG: COX15/CtaA family protein [Acetobacteraceae bacterium]|nr:COX15/CtaA family protein [Acetobacteraceae bacterium]